MNQSPQKVGSGSRQRIVRYRRRTIVLAVAVLVSAALLHYFWVGLPGGMGSFGPSLSGARDSRYREMSGIEQQRLRQQRKIARDLAHRYVGTPITGSSLEDLRVIQEILERAPLAPDQTFELQALGVALGDVMAARLDLDWIAFEDEYGRSRALRLGASDVVIFPVTMISKRVEAGLPVDLEELWEKTRRTVADARAGT